MPNDMSPSTILRTHLQQISERLAEFGTGSETRRLKNLARAIQEVVPGAASALVDDDASEVSRMRAFAVASAAVLRLPACDHANLVSAFEQVSALRAAA